MLNPFGEDDDDFDINYLIDRHLKVTHDLDNKLIIIITIIIIVMKAITINYLLVIITIGLIIIVMKAITLNYLLTILK